MSACFMTLLIKRFLVNAPIPIRSNKTSSGKTENTVRPSKHTTRNVCEFLAKKFGQYIPSDGQNLEGCFHAQYANQEIPLARQQERLHRPHALAENSTNINAGFMPRVVRQGKERMPRASIFQILGLSAHGGFRKRAFRPPHESLMEQFHNIMPKPCDDKQNLLSKMS